MKQRFYIDTNSGIGRKSFKEDLIPYTVGHLLDEMKYYRVHASIVYSNVAKDYSFFKGNMELIEQVKADNNRLFGVATIIPGIQYEIEEGFEYFDKLLKDGIRAFKVYPKTLQHEFNSHSFQDTAGYIIAKDIPLLVNVEEIDWQDLRGLLEEYPQLKIVLCNADWGCNRYVFPLMEKFRNLYIDINANQANDILDRCKKHFGVDRVLFGTNYPFKVMGGIKALVEYSGLSEEDKDKVSYKNAARLFNINELNLYDDKDCMLDEIALKVDQGRPLDDILVIDAHTHLVDKEHVTVNNSAMINGDEDNLVRKMDVLGIDKMFISSWEGLMTNGISANETDLKAWEKYKDRVEVYAMCNPNYNEDLEAVVDVYHERYRFKGLKPYYSANRYDLMGEKYNSWFEYGNRNKLIMLVHSGTEQIAEKVGVLSEKYKDMVFLMAHTGMDYSAARANIGLVKKRENVFLEITYTTMTNRIIEYMVDEVGADKVLFGTDMPMRDPAPQLAWVCYARISVQDKKKILGENILKLIDRCYS